MNDRYERQMSKRGQLIFEVTKWLRFLHFAKKNEEESLNFKPRYINKRSERYGNGKTYPRNTSNDKHKNHVTYVRHQSCLEKSRRAIQEYELCKELLEYALKDLKEGKNTTELYKIKNRFNDHNANYVSIILTQVAEYINHRFPVSTPL